MAAMTEADMKQFISDNMDSDLQFVLSDSGVSLEGQVSIARRYGSLRKFRAVGTHEQRCGLHAFAISPYHRTLQNQGQKQLP